MEISLTPFVCSVDTAAATVDVVAVCLVSIDIKRLRICILLHRLRLQCNDIRNEALHSHSARTRVYLSVLIID